MDVKTKFNIGDKVRFKNGKNSGKITSIRISDIDIAYMVLFELENGHLLPYLAEERKLEKC